MRFAALASAGADAEDWADGELAAPSFFPLSESLPQADSGTSRAAVSTAAAVRRRFGVAFMVGLLGRVGGRPGAGIAWW